MHFFLQGFASADRRWSTPYERDEYFLSSASPGTPISASLVTALAFDLNAVQMPE
jgi:hypothetical protein